MTEKKKEKPNNNIIWDEVVHTDPNFTKNFKGKGGFSGTSINAQYNIKRATNLFGPNGKGWGVTILTEEYKEGHPIAFAENGEITCKTIIHIAKVSVWYKLDGEKYETSPQFGQTTFVGSNKYGIYTDEEAPKKTITDAMNKCLALLGFGADIFLGMYDDNKYINDMKEQFKQEAKQEPEKQPFKPKDGKYHDSALTVKADRVGDDDTLANLIIDELKMSDNATDMWEASKYAPHKDSKDGMVGAIYLLKKNAPELYSELRIEAGNLFGSEQ